MTERFTPGPWKIDEQNPALILAPSTRPGFCLAAGISPLDAQLIAQAPSLYALVKEYLKSHQNQPQNFSGECACFECVAARRIIAEIEPTSL